MPPKRIMMIRHAEKPAGRIRGIGEDGRPNAEDLTARGWQRAGALVRLFAPRNGRSAARRLAEPDGLFASGIGPNSRSLRPLHTITPRARFLGQRIDQRHRKGQEAALAAAALRRKGIVLIAWEHTLIPTIANAIVGDQTTVPQRWPDDRFDVVWVLKRSGKRWTFHQVPQLLLALDSDAPIKPAKSPR
jgi:hypothetical protein